jgi:hypothetical protein
MGKRVSTSELDWEAVEQVLPSRWRELADERRLVRKLPEHMHAKVTDISQILRLVLYLVAQNVGLMTATAAFGAAGLLDISHVALHKWMKKLGPYLAELVAHMVASSHAQFAPERWAGLEIVLVDASCVQRPGSKGTTARVHRAFRATDLRVVQAHVTDETGGESFRRFQPSARQLWIGDRAYANPPGIQWLRDHGAHVLVRYNRGALPLFDKTGRRFALSDKLRNLPKASRPRQWTVFVHPPNGEPIAGRICAVRIPPDKAEQARERLRREQGSKVTDEALAYAEFVVVFTTIDNEQLGCEQVLELYALRWQVELDFKRDKSISGLDRLPNFLPCTIESWIYAKLLLHQILRCLADSGEAIPPSALATALCPNQDLHAAGARPHRSVLATPLACVQHPLEAAAQSVAGSSAPLLS